MNVIRAFTVCVDFSDLLAVTLPLNARHFREVWVITSHSDRATQDIASAIPSVKLFITDLFYRDGAIFNKGRAIVACLEAMGKTGQFVSMDADTILPSPGVIDWDCTVSGRLYSARRRMLYDVTLVNEYTDESKWKDLSVNRDYEHAGYFSSWFADDPHLRDKEWFSTAWRSAAGYDSEFQFHWPPEDRVWLPFEVLHLGFTGCNWCGRATQRVDGTTPDDSKDRFRVLRQMIDDRRVHGFSKERLDGKRDLEIRPLLTAHQREMLAKKIRESYRGP